MSVEQWKSICDIGTVVALFLAFAFGGGAWFTGNIINKQQAEEIEKFGIDLKNKDVRIAELTKEAEDEHMARIQLAASVSWRMPDRGLINHLAPPLQRFAGQRYAIVSDQGDPERVNVVGWTVGLLSTGNWKIETAIITTRSELTLGATNIVLWVSPTASSGVLEGARALVTAMEGGGLRAVVLQSGWGPKPDAAPQELIRIVVFKKGPRMTVTGNMITFDGSPMRIFLGEGPSH
jgi:hypothetical protein